MRKTSAWPLIAAMFLLATSASAQLTLAPVYEESFEAGLGGFAIDNGSGAGNGLWHRTTACNAALPGHSPVRSLYYGRDATCDYNSGLNQGGTATSPEIVVLDAAELSFRYFVHTEGFAPFDQASVQVSVDGGPFQLVASNQFGAGVSVLLDPSGAWQTATIDLWPLVPAGSSTVTVRVRFQFATIDPLANTFPGFYVDDVVVSTRAPLFHEDFEMGPGLFTIDNGFGAGNGLWDTTVGCSSVLGGHSLVGSLYYGVEDFPCHYDTLQTHEGVATSSPISVMDAAMLSFRYFLGTEVDPANFDQATVHVSVNGGPYQLVASNDPGAGVTVLVDPSNAWKSATVDLSPLLPAGSATVRVRFRFATGDDALNGFAGFYVDDVAVSTRIAPMYFQDFEVGLGSFAIDNGFGAGGGQWHLTAACHSALTGHSAVTSLYHGVDATCSYDAGNTEGIITSPEIHVFDSARLFFRYFMETAGFPVAFNNARVLVSVDGGPFELVASNDPGAGVELLDPSRGWRLAALDLPGAQAGASSVRVQFHFATLDVGGIFSPGFYVDDFRVIQLPEPGAAFQLGAGILLLAGLARLGGRTRPAGTPTPARRRTRSSASRRAP